MFATSLAAALLFGAAPAYSQIIFGQAQAIDGDTLLLGDSHIRLHGIDAVESSQQCTRNGATWACGADAGQLLSSLVAGKAVQCQQRDVDSYGRVVATCTANGVDLSQRMANAGYAVALPQYSDRYVGVVEQARTRGVGIWGGEFQMPSDYRAANPQLLLPPPSRPRDDYRDASRTAREVSPRQSQSGAAYYRNCAAARAAGAAPLRRGSPGYRPQLDADGDGIACEPYRPR
ncbi:thermonuclease family protein [Altererythrobacter sp. BO-6]|nr:thermonuclease family protein [Altererythrobacter sp. BO-6]QIG55375.1 thermonuclease family protein [Altererythrobacter sp. BO-6]